jgi:predicted DNA-binding transcriptional regulator AlpA
MPTKPLETELARIIAETIRANQPPPPPPQADPVLPVGPQSLTIDEWCEAHRLSRSTLYKMWRQGQGPKSYKAGRSRRIGVEADRAWQREAEAAA